MVQPFIDSLLHSFVHSFMSSVLDAFTHAFKSSFIHLFIPSSVHSFIHQSIHPSIHSFNHSFIAWFIYSFVRHFYIHPCIHPCIHWLHDSSMIFLRCVICFQGSFFPTVNLIFRRKPSRIHQTSICFMQRKQSSSWWSSNDLYTIFSCPLIDRWLVMDAPHELANPSPRFTGSGEKKLGPPLMAKLCLFTTGQAKS